MRWAWACRISSEGEGPRFKRPVRDRAAIDALGVPDPEQDLRYVMDTVRTISPQLDGRVPLIRFSGSPWTLATYDQGMSSTKTLPVPGNDVRRAGADAQPARQMAAAVTEYLNAQVAAGAQALMVFDTWGDAVAARLQDFRWRICSASSMG